MIGVIVLKTPMKFKLLSQFTDKNLGSKNWSLKRGQDFAFVLKSLCQKYEGVSWWEGNMQACRPCQNVCNRVSLDLNQVSSATPGTYSHFWMRQLWNAWEYVNIWYFCVALNFHKKMDNKGSDFTKTNIFTTQPIQLARVSLVRRWTAGKRNNKTWNHGNYSMLFGVKEKFRVWHQNVLYGKQPSIHVIFLKPLTKIIPMVPKWTSTSVKLCKNYVTLWAKCTKLFSFCTLHTTRCLGGTQE